MRHQQKQKTTAAKIPAIRPFLCPWGWRKAWRSCSGAACRLAFLAPLYCPLLSLGLLDTAQLFYAGMRQFECQRMGTPLFYQWKTLWSSTILSILAFRVFLDPDQQIKRRFILTIVTIGALLLLLFSEFLGSTKHPVTVGEWRSRALCHCCRRSTTLTALVVIMTGRGTSKRVCLTRSSCISGWSALLLVCMNSALPTFVYILIL